MSSTMLIFVVFQTQQYLILHTCRYAIYQTCQYVIYHVDICRLPYLSICHLTIYQKSSSAPVSKMSLAFPGKLILSPFGKQRIFVSSKTVFKFSIQSESTGPSEKPKEQATDSTLWQSTVGLVPHWGPQSGGQFSAFYTGQQLQENNINNNITKNKIINEYHKNKENKRTYPSWATSSQWWTHHQFFSLSLLCFSL